MSKTQIRKWDRLWSGSFSACPRPRTVSYTHLLPENRRRELAEIARRYGLILIEDDHYSFLENTACPPVSALLPERSVYIAGTSKSLSPGLRVAFMKTAPDLRGAVEQGLYNINLTTSHFNMEVVARLVESGLADKMMTQKRREAERRSQLAEDCLLYTSERASGRAWKGKNTMPAKSKTVYVCSECGMELPKWAGKCPGCGQWNTIQEEIRKPAGADRRSPVTSRAEVRLSLIHI